MTTIERAEEWLTEGEHDCYYSKSGCYKTAQIMRDLIADNKQLRQAIITCLDNNGHLADGDDCTLIDLKRAVPEWDGAPLGVFGAKMLEILELV